MRIVLMTVPAIVSGGILCFANSCLVLCDMVMTGPAPAVTILYLYDLP